MLHNKERSMSEGVGGRRRLSLATKSLIVVLLGKSFAKSVIGDGRGYSEC